MERKRIKRTKQVKMMMSEDEKFILDNICIEEDIDVSKLLRRLVKEYAQKRGF